MLIGRCISLQLCCMEGLNGLSITNTSCSLLDFSSSVWNLRFRKQCWTKWRRVSSCGWRLMKSKHLVFLPHITLNLYRLYYKNDPNRLSVCPLTVHGLLHIPWGVKVAGPVWTYWAYPMECHCNTLLQSIRSRCHPYASITLFVNATAQLDQIRLLYDLDDELCLDLTKRKATNLYIICVCSIITLVVIGMQCSWALGYSN